MESPTGPILDEAQYRQEVLGLPSAESEQAQAQQLADEAQQLGLKIPEVDPTAPLVTSLASGIVDLSSPVLSSGSSTDRNSLGGSVTPSHEPVSPSGPALDQVVSGLSDVTLASRRFKPGSTRSLASMSTRPTSFCSSEGRVALAGYGYTNEMPEATSNRHSMLSIASADKKEKRRSSFKSAIGRIHFRRKRPSATLLSPDAQVNPWNSAKEADHVFLQPMLEPAQPIQEHAGPDQTTAPPLPKLEIPVYSKESLQRSLDDPELGQMNERHRLERDRYLAFQDAAFGILRRRHQTAVSERQSHNERQEEEKREKNSEVIIRLEERQLAVEIEQQREFDRAKLNSSTRIKHMEGYFRNASPPPSPAGGSTRAERSSESFSETDSTAPARVFTRQHMEQLEQEYHSHESMDQLHDARIKVLRDRQELKMQEAMVRTEKELDDMCDRHTQAIATLQTEHQQEEVALTEALDGKKKNLLQRWFLEEAVLRRHLEVRNGQSYGPLPLIPFTSSSDMPAHVMESAPLESSRTSDTIQPNHDSVPL
ncbi:hypothetical protein MYU51_005897 [Penicillium brevicompactum]|uniref:uncharacterized protein n=1 Tax=Penicillium brevicompactum TaxID=5074 RepID=UPI0025411394|nr:uncharacterized protein N7506_004787 [Penicillium brevicompactum]KAJ5336765.1 hypothetical protein N7506_004787 [Penicillium brevicompactum]